MKIRLLGPLEAIDSDRLVTIAGPTQRALLAVLALRAPEVVAVDRLMDALWGESPPASGAKAIQMVVAKTRKTLPPGVIETRPGGYRLAVDPGDVDAVEFERLLSNGRDVLAAGDAAHARAMITNALRLWRGSPLAEFGDMPFARAERQRLEELRIAAFEERIEAELTAGAGDVVPTLEALVVEHPLRERFRAQLMRALYRAGRHAEALGVYRDARQTLVETLGIEPSSELQRLERDILQQADSLTAPAPWRPPRRLPLPATPLVGRTRELAEIDALLSARGVRLVTLTGVGGIGKTRLAIELATRAAGGYRDGAVFVGLADVRDPGRVAAAIGDPLGVRELSTRPILETLADELSERELLLVLDNFEHLLPAATQVAELLSSAPRLTVLATSRAPLRLGAEHEYPVRPLALPELHDDAPLEVEAARLFVERARAVAPHLAVDAPAVVQICRRLDGLPLALELAAARVRLLGLDEIAGRLDRRLSLLIGGPRDAPARQRTLRSTLAWSYDLLGAAEQRLFRRLSVFVGGFTLGGAGAVDEEGDTAERLETLLEHNLLIRDGAGSRFRMLETVREFADELLEKSGEAPLARRCHADHMLAVAAASSPTKNGGWPRLELLAADEENVYAAHRFLRAHDPRTAAELASAAIQYLRRNGPHRVLREWMEAILAEPDADAGLRAEALANLAFLALNAGDTTTAARLAREALALARRANHLWAGQWALMLLAYVAFREDDDARSDALAAEMLAGAKAIGTDYALFFALFAVCGVVASDPDGAAAHYEEALALARRAGDEMQIGIALAYLGSTRVQKAAYAEAAALELDALRLVSGRETAIVAFALRWLAVALAWLGEGLRAARLLGAAEGIEQRAGASYGGWPGHLEARNAALAELAMMLEGGELETALEAGRRLSLEEAVREAFAGEPAAAGPV